MFKHILLPTDGSTTADTAINACIALARDIGARITTVHAMPVLHLFTYEPAVTEAVHDQYRHEREAHAKQFLGSIEQRAALAGVPCTSLLVTGDEPYEAIIEAARTQSCDLIAMASHGRKGITGLLLGSQTHKVLTHSMIPVLVLR